MPFSKKSWDSDPVGTFGLLMRDVGSALQGQGDLPSDKLAARRAQQQQQEFAQEKQITDLGEKFGKMFGGDLDRLNAELPGVLEKTNFDPEITERIFNIARASSGPLDTKFASAKALRETGQTIDQGFANFQAIWESRRDPAALAIVGASEEDMTQLTKFLDNIKQEDGFYRFDNYGEVGKAFNLSEEQVFNMTKDEESRQNADSFMRSKGIIVGPTAAEQAAGLRAPSSFRDKMDALGIDLNTDEGKKQALELEKSGGINITIGDKGNEKFVAKLGELEAKQYNDVIIRGQAAWTTKQEVARMQSALASNRFTTGVFADSRVWLSQLADMMGVDPEGIGLGLGDPATADVLDAASAQMGIKLAQRLNRLTNMSLQFIKSSLPALSRTPDGNAILTEVLDRVADREIQIAKITDDYIREHESTRGKGVKSLHATIAGLERANPVISRELKERIIAGSKRGPKSWQELLPGSQRPMSDTDQKEAQALRKRLGLGAGGR